MKPMLTLPRCSNRAELPTARFVRRETHLSTPHDQTLRRCGVAQVAVVTCTGAAGYGEQLSGRMPAPYEARLAACCRSRQYLRASFAPSSSVRIQVLRAGSMQARADSARVRLERHIRGLQRL